MVTVRLRNIEESARRKITTSLDSTGSYDNDKLLVRSVQADALSKEIWDKGYSKKKKKYMLSFQYSKEYSSEWQNMKNQESKIDENRDEDEDGESENEGQEDEDEAEDGEGA